MSAADGERPVASWEAVAWRGSEGERRVAAEDAWVAGTVSCCSGSYGLSTAWHHFVHVLILCWIYGMFSSAVSSVLTIDFRNLMETSLFKDTFVVKFSWRSDQFVKRYEPNCGKTAYRAMLKNLKKFLDFQNLISSSLSIDISVVKFSCRSVQ